MAKSSLKALIPQISKALGMTPAALYERQRALVRAGLLYARPGRGPGSGVEADAKSLVMLLISVLAMGSLSEVEVQTKRIANLKSVDGPCPVTGKKTFAAALRATIGSPELLNRACFAVARRSGSSAMASITFEKEPVAKIAPKDRGSDLDISEFGSDLIDLMTKDPACLIVGASLSLQGIMHEVEFEVSK